MKKLLFTIVSTFTSLISVAQGDSCEAAIPMPYSNVSQLNGIIQATPDMWFTFVPLTTEVRITLKNTHQPVGHIHDLELFEGICNNPVVIGHGYARSIDTIITIEVHDLVVGAPYFLMTMRDRITCIDCCPSRNCASFAKFDLQVESLVPPVATEDTNKVIYLNGQPSHRKNEVVLRINKTFLKMNAVDNTNFVTKPMTVFVKPAMIQSMANKFYNGDHVGLGQLHLTKVFPTLTSADSTTLTRLGTTIRVPEFWETFVMKLPDSMSVFRVARALSALSGVRYADPNHVLQPTSVPNDQWYAANQSSLHPTITYPNGHIQAEGAWDVEVGKPFVNIGIYDTGIDQTHAEFSGKVGGGYNFYSGTALASPFDPDGHGSASAGIVGAKRNNSTGVAGIAGGDMSLNNHGCTLFDMKIAANKTTFAATSTTANTIISGALAAPQGYGLHIMNHSWAMGVWNMSLYDAVKFSAECGVTFVASRGNYPFTSTTINKAVYPACFGDYMVLNTGASGTNGARKTMGVPNSDPLNSGDQNYSSMTGQLIDFIAPGTTALVYTTQSGSNSYTSFNGTSAAAPHVAGVAGLLHSVADQSTPSINNLAPEDVERFIQTTCTDKGAPGYDDDNGSGLINATAALNKLPSPAYKVQHFGVGQNVTSSPFTQTLIAVDYPINLVNPYGVLNSGNYYADIYRCDFTLNYTLNSPTDQIIGFWPRYSSTVGWDLAQPVYGDSWCQITSISNTQAKLFTYIYSITRDSKFHLITDPWYPTQYNPKVALTLYTFDPAFVGVEQHTGASGLFNIYPNPSNGTAAISVALKSTQNLSLELYDAQGKLIHLIAKEKADAGEHLYSVRVDSYSEGVYFCRLTTDSRTEIKKLVVIK